MQFVETPGEVGPFGTRPIWERTVVGVASAILNAIADALGADFCEIPVTTEKIKEALVFKESNLNYP